MKNKNRLWKPLSFESHFFFNHKLCATGSESESGITDVSRAMWPQQKIMWFISSWYFTCLWIQAKSFTVLVLTWYSCFLHTSNSIRELNLNSSPKFISLCQGQPYTVQVVMGSYQITQAPGPGNSSCLGAEAHQGMLAVPADVPVFILGH